MELDNFDKEFLMEMFLDSDDVHNMNRLVVAFANVVTENNDNVSLITKVLKEENSCIKKLQKSSEPVNPSVVLRKSRKINYESLISNYTDEEYYDKFKMKKTTVQILINYLADIVSPSNIPLDKKVHIFLWLIMSDASYSEVAAVFGTHKSSVSYIFHEIATLLADHRYDFINWPSLEEQHINRIKVNSIFNFPNCVGFIDACCFKAGSKNTKAKPILLQAVCDASLSFIDIYITEIGVTKKNKVFRASPLSSELKNFVVFENHILGDSEYKLKKNLITPFTSDEVLTPEEMKFNEIHWKARSYIGHAFELLKEKFTKLHHIDVIKPDSVYAVICAACVLHNFVIYHEGGPEIKEERVASNEGVTIDTSVVSTAKEKREFLCNYINEIDSFAE